MASTPAAPKDCSAAKVEPAATLPMVDCIPAATDPATIPVEENPAAVRAPPVAATAPPVAARPLPILSAMPLFWALDLGLDIMFIGHTFGSTRGGCLTGVRCKRQSIYWFITSKFGELKSYKIILIWRQS